MEDKDILAAIDLLHELLMDGMDAEEAMKETLVDYPYNPLLLARKFKEHKFIEYTEVKPMPKEMIEAVEGEAFRKAMAVAENWAKKYESKVDDFGAVFTWKGEKHIFVVIQSNEPVWGLKAVRVHDQSTRRFSREAWAGIFKEIREAKAKSQGAQ